MSDLISLGQLDRLGAVAVLLAIAIAVITDKLVWHTRLKRETERADRWENIALEALTAGAQAGVRAAETAVDVVGALPDPELRRQRAARALADSAAEEG